MKIGKRMHFTEEQLQIISDGLEDTHNKMLNGTVSPISERYIAVNHLLRQRIKRELKKK